MTAHQHMQTRSIANHIAALRHPLFTAEIGLWIGLILLCNLSLLCGSMATGLVFTSPSLGSNTWFSWVTHPFVHASYYHLILDAGAFLSLYFMMRHFNARWRILTVLSCAAGSLVSVLISQTLTEVNGFCGLSGIAHGLMAFIILDMIANAHDKLERQVAWFSFLILICKSVAEAASGHVVLDFIHLGSVGTPLTICHAGGTLGGVVIYLLHHLLHSPSQRILLHR